MSVDPKILEAVSTALHDLRNVPQGPIPPGVIAALAPLASPGARVKIDLDASRVIGAPLVTVVERSSPGELFLPLTPRQKEVAGLMVEGCSNRQIADKLSISIATVKDHVHAILERLDLPTRSAVMAAAHSVTEP
ncbi:MAG: helix-turn-helix transcriptional regulator [Roseibium sp.]|uniref:helix-turn-helix transcriptional regulator n=1 Tax=Roseibium sp. TaxID=1936156 RepID=UPI00260DA5B2|nr:helix-turn-helix transcriptional regulator [Roseibium sp.]MCV0424898.1 helix-turn-helix transcriptional regulator [Roseibium sp.]